MTNRLTEAGKSLDHAQPAALRRGVVDVPKSAPRSPATDEIKIMRPRFCSRMISMAALAQRIPGMLFLNNL